MAHERLVAVSYPADGEFTSINAEVLGDLATLSYTDGMPEEEQADVLRRAEVLIGLRLTREVPAGTLQSAPGLRFIQLLSAGLDSVDFDAIAPDIMVAGNVGAYAHPIAEHVLAMVLRDPVSTVLLSAGLDAVDFDAIAPDIMVAGNVGAYAHPIAEHVLAMVL